MAIAKQKIIKPSLDITRTLAAHKIGTKIHVEMVGRYPVVSNNFAQFET